MPNMTKIEDDIRRAINEWLDAYVTRYLAAGYVTPERVEALVRRVLDVSKQAK